MFPFQFPIMPAQASSQAYAYDALFWTISLLVAVFTLLVGIMVLTFATKYKRGSTADRRNSLHHSTVLETLWTGGPTVLALIMFAWSAEDFIHVRTMPKNALEVFVIGKQWMWHLQHSNGIRENNELHIPVDRDIKFTMISQDVIHSMYLPEMRVQYHVVPGRYTDLWFHPTKVGKYHMLCAMHCGTQHSEMVGTVYVMTAKDYEQWLANGGNDTLPLPRSMAEAGRQTWNEKGCGNCHTGVTNERAPTLVGIFGTKREFTDGTSQVADEDYLRESIVNPYNKLTKGYENTMPVYKGQLSEEQVLNLISYIKSLSPGAGGSPEKSFKRADMPPTQRGMSSPTSATDAANKTQSAGDAQTIDSEMSK